MLGKLLALVLPLGLDTFAVAAALGAAGVVEARQQRRRVTLLMVGFEAGMPLAGLALGAPLGRAIGSAADYLAVAVLLGFGLYTLFAHRNDEEERLAGFATATGAKALLLGVSISLDELAIGFTFGLLRLPVVLVIVLIAAQTAVVSQLGMQLGHRLSDRSREGAERVAGLALTALALALLGEKLL